MSSQLFNTLLQRSCVFKWIAAVAVELDTRLPDHLPQLLAPLYREELDIMKTAGTIVCHLSSPPLCCSYRRGTTHVSIRGH